MTAPSPHDTPLMREPNLAQDRRDDQLKRLFDVAVAGVGLLAASPVMAAIAVAVRADTPGPSLFRQQRVGLGGKPFTMYKFRSMGVDGHTRNISATGDLRVTRTGKLLRKTKLDELPQLFNVLKGDMSLVGPRPEVPEYVAKWNPAHKDIILSVRPGITDPGSIAFRNEADLLAAADDPEEFYIRDLLPQKTQHYVDYVLNRSFMGDLKIIRDTIATVIRD